MTSQGAAGVVAKVIYDQLLYAPFATAVFFLVIKMAEGNDIKYATDFVRANLLTTMVCAWKVWPFVDVVNFTFVPAHLRVVFMSAVSVFWVTYLSVISNEKQEQSDSHLAVT